MGHKESICRLCGEPHVEMQDGRMAVHYTASGERCNPDVKLRREARTEPEPLTDQNYGVHQIVEGGAPGLVQQHR